MPYKEIAVDNIDNLYYDALEEQWLYTPTVGATGDVITKNILIETRALYDYNDINNVIAILHRIGYMDFNTYLKQVDIIAEFVDCDIMIIYTSIIGQHFHMLYDMHTLITDNENKDNIAMLVTIEPETVEYLVIQAKDFIEYDERKIKENAIYINTCR